MEQQFVWRRLVSLGAPLTEPNSTSSFHQPTSEAAVFEKCGFPSPYCGAPEHVKGMRMGVGVGGAWGFGGGRGAAAHISFCLQ